jgi:indolepyruvate ferredoxin oxidoreductase beta subunit
LEINVTSSVTNVVIAGLGGQGVLKASDILAQVAFDAGLDVKKSEVHGMAQRGGSVTSDVRFGPTVFSPMVPAGEADFVVVMASEEVEASRRHMKPGGVMIVPEDVPVASLDTPRSLNVALLGVLSAYLSLPESAWIEAVKANLPEKLHQANFKAFSIGHSVGRGEPTPPVN